MAISINFVTGEITVPKADTILVSIGPPEIRFLDVQLLRLDVLDLQSAPDGRIWSTIIDHEGEVTISGFTYARKIVFQAPFFITIEDGAYVVNLGGANHNVLDVATANSVSLRAQNSGGLLNLLQASEMWQLKGLDINNPLTITDTNRTAGGINQTINDDGTTTTVTRT